MFHLDLQNTEKSNHSSLFWCSVWILYHLVLEKIAHCVYMSLSPFHTMLLNTGLTSRWTFFLVSLWLERIPQWKSDFFFLFLFSWVRKLCDCLCLLSCALTLCKCCCLKAHRLLPSSLCPVDRTGSVPSLKQFFSCWRNCVHTEC